MIGIIGGMGPAAGFDLAQKVTRHTLAERDQEHLDVIVMSLPSAITDRTAYLTGRESTSPAGAIADVARRLEAAGCTIAAMACNTAHAPRIIERVEMLIAERGGSMRMLNMIAETIRFTGDAVAGAVRVGVLSTRGSREIGLYPHALGRAGFDCVELSDDEHDACSHDAIYHPEFGVKSTGERVSDEARARVLRGIELLAERGADAVILGCTELPLAVPEATAHSIPLIDPAVATARALIREYAPEHLRPLATLPHG
jgi:aspartate racemase